MYDSFAFNAVFFNGVFGSSTAVLPENARPVTTPSFDDTNARTIYPNVVQDSSIELDTEGREIYLS